MPCNVRLYNNATFAALTSSNISVLAVDTSTSTNLGAALSNGPLSSGYGVHLPFTTRRCIYEVAVRDSSRTYAGLTIPSLNADISGQLEIILSPPPVSFSGTGASTATQLVAYLARQTWSLQEMAAVVGVINAYRSLQRLNNPLVGAFLDDYVQTLLPLGINQAAL